MKRRTALILIGVGTWLTEFGQGVGDVGFWLLPDAEQVPPAHTNGAPDVLQDAVHPTEDLPHTG